MNAMPGPMPAVVDPTRWLRLAAALVAKGETAEAAQTYDAAIAMAPKHPAVLREYGNFERLRGRLDRAEKLLLEADEIEPGHAAGLLYLAATRFAQARYDEALRLFHWVRDLSGESVETAYLGAVCLQELKREEESVTPLSFVVHERPDHRDAWRMLGIARDASGDKDGAIAALERAIAIDANDVDAGARLYVLLMRARREEEARRVVALADGPSRYLRLRGQALQLIQFGGHREALEIVGAAVAVAGPKDVTVLALLAEVYERVGLRVQALDAYEAMLRADPSHPFARGQQIHLRQRLCIWKNYDEFIRGVEQHIERASKTGAPLGFHVHDLQNLPIAWSTIVKACECAGGAIERAAAPARAKLGWSYGERFARWRGGERRKLRVGYTVPYSKREPFTLLHLPIVEAHDHARFEVYGYSRDPHRGTEFDDRYRGAYDVFRDVPADSAEQAAQLIHADQLDVLLDVTGHTDENLQAAIALRPAAVQAEIFGSSTTVGGAYMDYWLADEVYVPPHLGNDYCEALVYLPDAQFVGYRPEVAKRSYTRADLGLPAEGFVFACFNQSFKFEPAMFAAWMRILQRVPNSVLWLGAWDTFAKDHLCAFAAAHGVDPQRLVFAMLLKNPEHLARLAHADLALDTSFHGGGATTLDGLAMGVPFVSWMGPTPGALTGASISRALRVGGMTATTLREYEDLAVALANDRPRLQALRQQVKAAYESSPMFDPVRFCRHLEIAVETMWAQAVAGVRQPFAVPALPG